jgi:hypothetical protein
MFKIIVTLNNHKVIEGVTEKLEEHQELTLKLENELPKYLDYLRVYLEDKLFRLSQKISRKYFGKENRQKPKSNIQQLGDR